MSGHASAAQQYASMRHERHASQSTARSRGEREERYDARRSHLDGPRRSKERSTDDYMEGDVLAPLQAQPRKPRQRVDSLSSLGSSVAPAGGSRAYQRTQRHDYGTYDSQASSSLQASSRTSTGETSAEGGLEAWLRTQAEAGPPGDNDNLKRRSLTARTSSRQQQEARFRALDAIDDAAPVASETQTDTRQAWQSTGGRQSSQRYSSSTHRKTGEDEAEDISGLPSSSGFAARRRTPSAQGGSRGFMTWLEAADVDSQVGSEHRRRRREGGPQASAIMSASGVRLREGIRKSSNRTRTSALDQGVVPSIDALLTRSAILPSSAGTGLSSSQSLGAASMRRYATGEGLPGELNALPTAADKDKLLRAQQRESQLSSPLRIWSKWILTEGTAAGALSRTSTSSTATLTFVVLASALVKWCTGLSGWSGKGAAPLHGDLEAQRHWMEITLHLPMKEWYFYDLQYWGLDYPPLTAFVSQWCGMVGQNFPSVRPHLALDTSRGSEDQALILFLRATVLVLDLLVYTPAVLFFLHRRLKGRGRRTRAIAASTALLQPALILVDHGHFQYNGVMLGLSAAAFALLYTSLPNTDVLLPGMHQSIKSISRRISFEYVGAAILFSWSLCFKQMALYYAPAVFAIMLGRCVGLARVGFERGLICFIGIGLATSITFGIFFAPWLTSLTQITQVVHRIFPLARGLFEDKVSNVWCFLSVLPVPARYKLRNTFNVTSLARLSLVVTLASILLPCLHLFVAAMETVHVEMHLAEDSRRQVEASERRKAEGSTAGSTTTSRARTRSKIVADGANAPSEAAFSDLASGLPDGAANGVGSNMGLTKSMLLQGRPVASTSPSPAAAVLPYALLSTSLAFFLFGFQTHEKSVLLPLLPMTLLMSVKGDEWGGGAGKTDWQWAALMNNVAMFSMWPLLKRDQIVLQYIVVTVGWNWAIGYNPFASFAEQRRSFVAILSALAHLAMLGVHALEIVLPSLAPSLAGRILARYPDFFPVLVVLLSTPLLGVVWLWALKRQLETGFANGIDVFGMTRGMGKAKGQARGKSVEAAKKTL